VKKILGVISVVALTISVFAANHHIDEVESFYVRGDVGGSAPYVSNKTTKFYSSVGPVYNVGVGYKFNEDFRSDINFQYSSFSKSSGNGVTAKTAMLNGYYDFVNDTIFTPYVTVGLGFSKVNSEENFRNGSVQVNKKSSTNSFAWNTGIGSRVSISKDVDLDFAYKFVSLGKTLNNKVAYANQITGGLIYNF
jgi:opacity protein-like surface antigen